MDERSYSIALSCHEWVLGIFLGTTLIWLKFYRADYAFALGAYNITNSPTDCKRLYSLNFMNFSARVSATVGLIQPICLRR